MIRLQDLTPSVYYTQSRDFQFIGRLYDLVLNYLKTNAANLYNLPSGKNLDEQLLNLLALTLGLKPTKKYNSKQLRAICSVLPMILRHKGSLQALVLATNALLAAEGVKQPLDYAVQPKQGITLYVAQEIEDLTLLTDLLDYLLPAGLSCTIVKCSQVVSKAETVIGVQNTVKISGVDATSRTAITTDALDATALSIILGKRSSVEEAAKLQGLSLGEIGIRPGILSNTLITSAQQTTSVSQVNPSEGEIKND